MENTPLKIDLDFRYYGKDAKRLNKFDDIEDMSEVYGNYRRILR